MNAPELMLEAIGEFGRSEEEDEMLLAHVIW
jgi:hypothetical protein